MKKTYQNPTTKLVKIQVMQMIAASEQMFFGDSVITAEGAEGRKGGGFWDDEEE